MERLDGETLAVSDRQHRLLNWRAEVEAEMPAGL
jgi:hypothetical protein